jgi:hypothetical protein
MTLFRLACTAAALACVATAQAAPPMSKEEMKAQKVRIEEQYDNAQTRCRRVQGHARELCNERARGDRDIQSAELQLQANPTPEHDRKLRLARAEAAYSMALVRCKPLEGSARDVCRKDAKDTYAIAKTEAKLQAEVAETVLRSENTVRERTTQEERVAAAQYAAARERCELLPGEGRANCLADIKQRFGQ